MAVSPIPKGYHTITPYLVVTDAARLVEFLKQTFGAEELHPPMLRPDGKIAHAELRIGDSPMMISEAGGPYPPMPAMLYVYVPNVDAVYERALKAGATSVQAPADQFYGDRNGGVKDHCGNQWWIGTHIEDVPPEEMEKRAAAAMAKKGHG